MKNGIKIKNYHYCQWYNEPPVYIRCPHMKGDFGKYCCDLYKTNLKSGDYSDMWSCETEFCVKRCEECKIDN